MSASLLIKARTVIKAVKTIKNWNLYLLLYFGLLRNNPIFIFKNNFKIKIRANSTDFYVLTNIWLLEEYDNKKIQIKQDDLIIDIGAHIGLFTIYASQFCNNGKIYCYEPIKENYDLLVQNIELNNIKNTTIFQKAVTDKSSIARIFLNKDSAAHSIFNESKMYVDIESTSLKDIFESNKIEKCDLLKLDCEGSEYIILNSLSDFYFHHIKKIVLEYHMADTKPELLENLIKKLRKFDYKLDIKKNTNDSGIIFAIKK